MDAGCGTGQYTKALLDFGVGKFTLLDASAAMLDVAKQKLSEFISNGAIADIVQATLPALPFSGGTFDAVMFNTVIRDIFTDSKTI